MRIKTIILIFLVVTGIIYLLNSFYNIFLYSNNTSLLDDRVKIPFDLQKNQKIIIKKYSDGIVVAGEVINPGFDMDIKIYKIKNNRILFNTMFSGNDIDVAKDLIKLKKILLFNRIYIFLRERFKRCFAYEIK